jgi:hypothetical protein
VQNLAFAKRIDFSRQIIAMIFSFGFSIQLVLCHLQALVKVLSAMPFPVLPEVVAFLFADYEP